MNLIYANTGERNLGFGISEKFKNISQGKVEIININWAGAVIVLRALHMMIQLMLPTLSEGSTYS